MSNTTDISTDIWGQDVALDETGQAKVAATGELVLTEGVDTGVQDILLRVFTRLGSLFYDKGFGSLIHDWVHEESTGATRAAFAAEVTTRVEADPRVVTGSVRCEVVAWDEKGITARARWRFIEQDSPLNLVLQLNKLTMEWVVKDADAREDSFTADIKVD